MFIHEMTESECRHALDNAVFARLACASNNQPYVVPIFFALDRDYIYGFATLGQKIEWMRENPLVCVEIDEWIAHDRWQSVVVFGHYEELPDLPEYKFARLKAYEMLAKRIMWWEPAAIGDAHRDTPHSATPIFYRIEIHRMTGHKATPDAAESINEAQAQRSTGGWWSRMFRHTN
jgi:nitroimidazol reductase NimA-like FMN-containing flavoprotein (pyridoxamine 5'-phosphate oxidase superfamily)